MILHFYFSAWRRRWLFEFQIHCIDYMGPVWHILSQKLNGNAFKIKNDHFWSCCYFYKTFFVMVDFFNSLILFYFIFVAEYISYFEPSICRLLETLTVSLIAATIRLIVGVHSWQMLFFLFQSKNVFFKPEPCVELSQSVISMQCQGQCGILTWYWAIHH